MKVCAMRVLELAEDTEVKILFELPEQDTEPGGHYACRYEISGLNGVSGGISYGIDSAQALYLALCIVGAKLYTSPQWKDGRLLWNGDKELGFPVPTGLEEIVRRNQ